MTIETTAPTAAGPAPRCGCPDDADHRGALTRRSFLRTSLGVGAGAIVLGSGLDAVSTQHAWAADAAYDGDVLVVLSLRGGFDGLSAVVPHGDPDYYRLRPSIGVPAAALVAKDAMFGLHPALAPLLPWWQNGTFGAVHAVGQASPSRSHFAAMEEMERAAPGTSLRTGWLDRVLGLRTAGTPFQASQVGQTSASPALLGPSPELALRSVDSFALAGASNATERERWAKALAGLHRGAPATLRQPAETALHALSTTASLKAAGYTPAAGATYPAGRLGEALRDLARLIKAGVGLQAACVDYGDWDMHEGLGKPDSGWMHTKLTELATALAAFATDLGPAFAKVCLVTMSEFGRRVAENGSGGADHGHGNAMLLLGGGVVGGRVCRRPRSWVATWQASPTTARCSPRCSRRAAARATSAPRSRDCRRRRAPGSCGAEVLVRQ
jgi:uncharacterized protein (DUF1501 family)